jgi:hypothetical protein
VFERDSCPITFGGADRSGRSVSERILDVSSVFQPVYGRITDQSEKNVVFLGVSISQFLLMTLAALSLLVLTALLWMNHRIPDAVQPLVVLQQAGVLCPVDPVSRPSPVYSLRLPARAPPTFLLPSSFLNLDPRWFRHPFDGPTRRRFC